MSKEIQKQEQETAIQRAEQYKTLSLQLTECLTKLESSDENVRADGKLALVLRTSELMPKGAPNFRELVQYPTINSLTATAGRKNMLKVLLLIIKDFADSVNVVRNMSMGQITEAAGMLLDECGNFRLEDYVMMFALAKRGQLVKIMDRIDIETIGKILDAYWLYRNEEGKKIQEQETRDLDKQINDSKIAPEIVEKWNESIKNMEQDLEAQKEREFKIRQENTAKSYATLMGVDMDKVREVFVKPKKSE